MTENSKGNHVPEGYTDDLPRLNSNSISKKLI